MTKKGKQVDVDGIGLIRSEDDNGCAIACLAMVLGKEYQQVRRDWSTNFNQKAFKPRWYESYLYDNGCSVIKKRCRIATSVRSAQMCGAMLKPFAPVHIIQIQQAAEWEIGHAVVMDALGQLYDPSGATHDEVLDSIYAVPVVYGIWRPQDHENKQGVSEQ